MFTISAIALWLSNFFYAQLFGSGEWHTCERCTHECNLPLHKSHENDEKICDECAWKEYAHKHNAPWAVRKNASDR